MQVAGAPADLILLLLILGVDPDDRALHTMGDHAARAMTFLLPEPFLAPEPLLAAGAALFAAGSAMGGLAYGAVTWRADVRVRLALLGVLLGGAVAAAGSMPEVATLAGAVGVAGLFVSPLLGTASLIADESAGPGSRTRAGAWVNTAFNAGPSTGTAGAGMLLGGVPLAWCTALAALPLLATAVAARRR
ncbi:hypothetical protein GCM10009678_38890 [Actinomadura kijaniata]|uniref:Putative MFS family arabinose efflux permease n=1 Tax=Actinomadura namibiensis TaxID=182080 RepID=A0A7W3LV96_ACTNM|nr:hypothetical protein [Actinomadura namibiensis]MBA8954862.1 putative MFS family arabinose efflux permease [Actinomadura namibiensis]